MNNTIALVKKITLYLKYPRTGNRLLRELIFSPRREAPPLPRLFIVYITESCNLNCSFCLNASLRKTMAKKGQSFLSLAYITKIAEEARKFNAMVYLIGGEPLIHPHFRELVKIFKKNKILLSTTTNGLLLAEYADFIAHYFDFISISLDYPDALRHDQSRNKKGLYERLITGLENLIKARGRHLLPNIKINTVILKDNLRDLTAIYQLANELGVDELSIEHFSFKNKEIEKLAHNYCQKNQMFGSYVDGSLIKQKNFLSEEEIRILEKELKKLEDLAQKGKVRLTILPLTDNLKDYYLGKMPSKNSFCLQPFAEINIRADGEIQFCQDITLGNLEHNSIEEVWASERAQQFRSHLLKRGITPACYRCCALHYIFSANE